MTLKKKIFGSIFILACLGLIVGGYFWWQKMKEKEFSLEKMPEIPDIDLSFSPLEKADLPEINLNLPLDFSAFEMDLPDLSAESFIDIKNPDINLNISGLGSGINFGEASKTSGDLPPPNWEPDEATCQKFKTAPSCIFVPEQYRELCEKCKAKKY